MNVGKQVRLDAGTIVRRNSALVFVHVMFFFVG